MARLFEVFETPLPGTDWYTRKIKRTRPMGEDEMVWLVQLMKESDGTPVEFRHADLHIAWVRAIEAARSHELGLNNIEPSPEGTRASYNDAAQPAGGQSRS